MGREIKRVPVDFDWPLHETWDGFLRPDRFDENPCPGCREAPSWHGHVTSGDGLTPEARAIANTFYPHQIGGSNADALAWCDKLGQAEVDMLVEEGRIGRSHLYDRVTLDAPYEVNEYGYEVRFRWDRNDRPAPTAEEVNAENRRGDQRARTGWAGFGGHDAINRMLLIRFRCAQLGIQMRCPNCEGNGSLEAYEGQRAESEAWKPTEPPTGDGWQMWETVTEGSPVSPVFSTAEKLARWLTTAEGGQQTGPSRKPMTIEQARGFVGEGWAPTGVIDAGGGHDGAEYVGTKAALRTLEEN